MLFDSHILQKVGDLRWSIVVEEFDEFMVDLDGVIEEILLQFGEQGWEVIHGG